MTEVMPKPLSADELAKLRIYLSKPAQRHHVNARRLLDSHDAADQRIAELERELQELREHSILQEILIETNRTLDVDAQRERAETAEADAKSLAGAVRVAFQRGFGDGHGEHDFDEFCEIYGITRADFDRLIAPQGESEHD